MIVPVKLVDTALVENGPESVGVLLGAVRESLEALTDEHLYLGPPRFGWRPLNATALESRVGAANTEAILAALAAVRAIQLRLDAAGPRLSVRDSAWARQVLDSVDDGLTAFGDKFVLNVEPRFRESAEALLTAIGVPFFGLSATVAASSPEGQLGLRPKGTESLNAQQLQVVLAPLDRPLLVNAGAGTGKTHTMAHRVSWLVHEHGIEPERIAVLTFSRAARAQIFDRLVRLGQAGYRHLDRVSPRTIHSLGWDILREAARLGCTYLRGGFTRLEEVPSALNGRTAWRLPFADFRSDVFDGLDDDLAFEVRVEAYPAVLDALRGGYANVGLHVDPATVPDGVIESGTSIPLQGVHVREVWRRYQRYLDEQNAIDYAGMVTEAIAALQRSEALRRTYAAAYKVILVDEFQDTSVAQVHLLRALASEGAIINVVGDVDQTILSFAGASIGPMEEFATAFPTVNPAGVLELPLEHNYRSERPIIDVANHILARNPRRLAKTLRERPGDPWQGDPGSVLTRVSIDTLGGAAVWVAGRISDLLREGVPAREIAVLYRKETETYAQRTTLQGALEELSIPIAADSDTDPNGVRLLTVHSAKGREFDVVFVLYLDRNQFPDQRCGTQEERRLLYVAITRARHRLFLLGKPSLAGRCFFRELDRIALTDIRESGVVERFAKERSEDVDELFRHLNDPIDWD